MKSQICNGCHQELPITEFYIRGKTMSKWRCDDCVDDENTSDSCVLYCNKKPSTCPYSGTDCDWYSIEDKDNE